MSSTNAPDHDNPSPASLGAMIRFCLRNKLLVVLLLLGITVWGFVVAPFPWKLGDITRAPIQVDVTPNLGLNQQVVLTAWSQRSPQDVERHITSPLASVLMGLQGVKLVRSYSRLGLSTIHVEFRDNVDYHGSRTRILEKLNNLPARTVPSGTKPSLGPDATVTGRIFQYTLEGRSAKGKGTGGWDLYELRNIQDGLVRRALQSVQGVAEVASIGGFVAEYQVTVNPQKLKALGLTILSLYRSIRASNVASSVFAAEMNRVEYFVRLRGGVRNVQELENTVVRTKEGRTLRLVDLARVTLAPAPRRGALNKDGASVVGGVVFARHGTNSLRVIQRVKAKIASIAGRMPHKRLKNGRVSRVAVVPFYDRSQVIQETLHTLEEAITLEVLITILVVIAMLLHLRSALLIAGLLPVAVFACFGAMKIFGVGANIVALSGIAIAIGTMVDMGIVLSENIVQHLEQMEPEEKTFQVVLRATLEVGPAILTAVSTTILSFLPVFALQSLEGKLFRPLAITQVFALLAALLITLFLLPPLAHMLFLVRAHAGKKPSLLRDAWLHSSNILLVVAGSWLMLFVWWWFGVLILLVPVYRWVVRYLPHIWMRMSWWVQRIGSGLALSIVGSYLVLRWMPLGHDSGYLSNFLFVVVLVGLVLFAFELFRRSYSPLLKWCLIHKKTFLLLPLFLLLLGANICFGFDTVFGWLPRAMSLWEQSGEVSPKAKNAQTQTLPTSRWLLQTSGWKRMTATFPGLRKEFVPDLDEGSFLWTPKNMPHVSMTGALEVLEKLNRAIRSIPEVSSVVGRMGRSTSSLSVASPAKIEIMVNYKPKFRRTSKGKRLRQWRKQIHTQQDLWREVAKATQLLGTTSASRMQPMGASLMMLQHGIRAPMGLKVTASSFGALEKVLLSFERALKHVPQIMASTVVADRLMSKPYLDVEIKRNSLAALGLNASSVGRSIQMTLGRQIVTTVLLDRERRSVVIRYPRAWNNSIPSLLNIQIPTPQGGSVPLRQIASLKYVRGPSVIQTENNRWVAHVGFDRKAQFTQLEAVDAARRWLQKLRRTGELKIPKGVNYRFVGMFDNLVRSEGRLLIFVPLTFLLMVVLLFLQFRSIAVAGIVFSGVLVACAGGFLLIWLYQTTWFLNFSIFGIHLRELFSIQGVHMNVAIWVGFIALFGIATDDGVVMATYLKQSYRKASLEDRRAIREATMLAGERRIRPCLMTSATTLLALFPVMTSAGRGSDIMVSMAIPAFGGMLVALLTLFVVPVLSCWREELLLKRRAREERKRKRWWQIWKRKKEQTKKQMDE